MAAFAEHSLPSPSLHPFCLIMGGHFHFNGDWGCSFRTHFQLCQLLHLQPSSWSPSSKSSTLVYRASHSTHPLSIQHTWRSDCRVCYFRGVRAFREWMAAYYWPRRRLICTWKMSPKEKLPRRSSGFLGRINPAIIWRSQDNEHCPQWAHEWWDRVKGLAEVQRWEATAPE